MNDQGQEVKHRILNLVKTKGITQRKLAEAIGITPGGVNKWFKQNSVPKTENLEKLAAVLDTTASYLLFGGDVANDRPIKLEDGYVLIPHINVAASCGHGAEGMTEKPLVKFIKTSTEWLRCHAPFANHSALNMIVASGDSMAPTIKNGDMVLVDTSVTNIKTDAMYVFVKGGEVFLKRIQRIASGLRVISDNPVYPPFDIPELDLEQFRIVGRVCSIGNFKEV